MDKIHHIDSDRLQKRLSRMAQVGKRADGGCNRQALTLEDSAGRQLFCNWCENMGLNVRFDAIGNLFACWPSKTPNAEKLLIGSHLDTQPNGGKYDGVYGVLAGLEIVESVIENDIELPFDIELVVWTNEEGCRFPFAMMGSAVWSGELALEEALILKDDFGVSVRSALIQLDQHGSFQLNAKDVLGSLELHIEQGPVLEAEETQIGVVNGVQQMSRWQVTITGTETHAGPSPMSLRVDPMQQAAALINQLFKADDHFDADYRLTIGKLDVLPNSPNTVPGQVCFTVDLRHPDPTTHEDLENWCLDQIDSTEKSYSHSIKPEKLWHANAVAFDDLLVRNITAAAEQLNYSYKSMVSGAGHDSVNVSQKVPTAMIFVPCLNGLSHNPAEHISTQQATEGANVLLNTVLNIAGIQ